MFVKVGKCKLTRDISGGDMLIIQNARLKEYLKLLDRPYINCCLNLNKSNKLIGLGSPSYLTGLYDMIS